MNWTKTLLAALVGAIVAFIFGYLFWGVLFADFFASNAGTASGVSRGDGEMQWVPLIVGHLFLGFLFAYIFARWASISTWLTGLKAGALLGFLIAASVDMMSLGTSNIMTWTSAFMDIVLMTVNCALMGAAIGWMLGRK